MLTKWKEVVSIEYCHQLTLRKSSTISVGFVDSLEFEEDDDWNSTLGALRNVDINLDATFYWAGDYKLSK